MEKIKEEGILIDIFSRLPAKSLSRFKCVSKQWYSLISNPQFAKSHLMRSLEERPSSCHRILLTNPLRSVDYDFNEGIAIRQLLHEKIPDPVFKIAGSCNGLVCLVTGMDTFVMFNPTTGDSRKLPKPMHINLDHHFFYGFGYDSSTDDYKLVRGCSPDDDPQPDFIVEIFSLKGNCWKRIDCNPHLKIYGRGIFFNGSLHWLVSTAVGAKRYKSRIVSLDLADEKFDVVLALPDVGHHRFFEKLSIIEGCLSTNCGSDPFSPREPMDVWVMSVYREKSSWTKFCSLDRITHCRLFCCRKDGSILFDLGESKLVTYNPREDHFNLICPRSRRVNRYYDSDSEMYVESLISPC